MKRILLAFTVFAFVACQTSPNAVEVKGKKGELLGKYTIKLIEPDVTDDLDSQGVGEKLALSLLSLVKVQIEFKENGYAFFDGQFGFLDFDETKNQDSVAYWVKDGKLYMDNLDVNGEDYLDIEPLEDGLFKITTDSLQVYLEPMYY